MENKNINIAPSNQDAVEIILNMYPNLTVKGQKMAFEQIKRIVRNLENNFNKIRNDLERG